MSRTLVTGATGTLGTALRARLADSGHRIRAASRSPPGESEWTAEWVELDLVNGSGLDAALDDVDVLIHAATAPQGDSEAVDVQGTKGLLDAAETADIDHFLYPSIVGIEEIPFSYYEHKLAAERAVEKSDVPTTILRATQFHEFVADLLGYVAKLPIWPLPTKMQIQPIAVGEVADVIVDHATMSASGRTDPIGGPDVQSLGDLARSYRTRRDLRRPIVRLPIPGSTVSAFRAGHGTCPEHTVGMVTWEEWLEDREAVPTDGASTRVQTRKWEG